MPKALCLISLVASILVVVLFLADLVLGMLGSDFDSTLAPMKYASPMMDITFIILGGIMIFMSWITFREQR